MQCKCTHLHSEHMWEQQPEPCLAEDCVCQEYRPAKLTRSKGFLVPKRFWGGVRL